MAITNRNDFFNAFKQDIGYDKTSTRVTAAGGWFSIFDIAGAPGSGTLAIGNTANGVVVTITSGQRWVII